MSQKTNVQTNLVPSDYGSDLARTQLLIKTALSGIRTSMPVQVVAVTNAGGVSAIGYVDVKPLVSLLDGAGVAIPHGIVHNIPYMRIQGGSNGIILDPVVGDIGIASVCDRDISTVKNTKAASPPGSNRKYDMSDMVYLMTVIGQAPSQYIQFNAEGLTIHSPVKVKITAPNIEMDGDTQIALNAPNIVLNGAITQGSGSFGGTSSFKGNMNIDGTVQTTGDVTANGTSVHTHKHGGVQTGGGQTGVPV